MSITVDNGALTDYDVSVEASTEGGVQHYTNKPRAQRVDEVSSSLMYVGIAEVGSLTSASSWRIYRVSSTAGSSPIIEWADGNSNYDNIWDNRAALVYN